MKKSFEELTEDELKTLANKYAYADIEDWDIESVYEYATDKRYEELMDDKEYLKELYNEECDSE